MTDKQPLTEVRDRPAELWIKVLGLVAVVTIPLIGIIGSFLIDGQKITNAELKNINDKMSVYSVKLEAHSIKISRNKDDINDLNVIVDSNLKRIYELEGKK